MEVTRATSPADALEAATASRFDLMTVFFPLSEVETTAFLENLRDSQHSPDEIPTILIAHQPDIAALEDLALPGGMVVNLDDRDEILRSRIAEALGVAARLSIRIPVRLEIGLKAGRSFRFCETRDISRSGILISSGRPLPVGADFRFQLTLPYTYTPLAGRAEVVRHTDQQREQTTGFGARYVDLGKGDVERLEAYIRQELVDRSAPELDRDGKIADALRPAPSPHDDERDQS
jgi:hypothetical protein